MSSMGRFYFRPQSGEQLRAELCPAEEQRASIVGRVLGREGEPLGDALALLFLPGEDDSLTLISRSLTDDDGHFIFGPLEPGTLYLIKVFKDELKLRELEIRTE